jgi:hypothetical protein
MAPTAGYLVNPPQDTSSASLSSPNGQCSYDLVPRLVISDPRALRSDRGMLRDVKVAASGGKRRRALQFGERFQSARSTTGIARRRDFARSTWRHIGRGLVHPDADDGRCRHRLDRVPAVGDEAIQVMYGRRPIDTPMPYGFVMPSLSAVGTDFGTIPRGPACFQSLRCSGAWRALPTVAVSTGEARLPQALRT